MTAEQENDVTAALLAYWTSRDEARIAQEKRGIVDVGGRAGVTSGGHLDRVAQMLGRVCLSAGVPASQLFYKTPRDDPMRRAGMQDGFTLPGFFRPTKQWDLVVYHRGIPVVVIELKSQNGPSYGNNANNRAEEALGNAMDLTRAIEAGYIPGKPWTGYVYVIEDDLLSREVRGSHDAGIILRSPKFNGWSYISRVGDLCRGLMDESFYDATWAIAACRPTCPRFNRCPQIRYEVEPHIHEFGWTEIDSAVSGYRRFIENLTTHLAEYFAEIDPTAPASTGMLF